MRYIGNIVNKGKPIEEGIFFETDDMSKIDPSLPTLIIGWTNTVKAYPNTDILDWKINDNVFWTFGKRENNSQFQKRVNDFKELCFDFLREHVKYTFINVLTISELDKKRLNEFLKTPTRKVFYLCNNMLFFSGEKSYEVYGISLDDILYKGGNPHLFVSKLKIKQNNAFITEREIPISIITAIADNDYLMPFFCNT